MMGGKLRQRWNLFLPSMVAGGRTSTSAVTFRTAESVDTRAAGGRSLHFRAEWACWEEESFGKGGTLPSSWNSPLQGCWWADFHVRRDFREAEIVDARDAGGRSRHFRAACRWCKTGGSFGKGGTLPSRVELCPPGGIFFSPLQVEIFPLQVAGGRTSTSAVTSRAAGSASLAGEARLRPAQRRRPQGARRMAEAAGRRTRASLRRSPH